MGIKVRQRKNYWIEEINKRLKEQALVSYVVRRPVAEVPSGSQLDLLRILSGKYAG